ncbi:MAG: hypothetical protein KJ718_00010 [Nanoarchaeota archaeon]|nr:hypothetical protein [Nanoarchaeota archaeon]
MKKPNRFLKYATLLALLFPSINLPANAKYHTEPSTQQKLSAIEEKIQPVPKSTLPKNIAGFVRSGTQTGEGLRGEYGTDFPSPFTLNTMYHEQGHAFGIKDEHQADLYAAGRTGNPYLIRGPFYRPPINL